MNIAIRSLKILGSVGMGTCGVAIGACCIPLIALSFPAALIVAKMLPTDDEKILTSADEEDDGRELTETVISFIYGGIIFGVLVSPLIPTALCFEAASRLWPSTES